MKTVEYQISKKIDSQIMKQEPLPILIKTIKEEFGKGLSNTQAKKILEEIVVQTVRGNVQKGGRISLPQVYFNPEDIRGGRKTRKNHNRNQQKKQQKNRNNKKQRQQRGGKFGSVSDNAVPVGGGSDGANADLAGPHAAEQGASHLTFADSPPSTMQQGIDLVTGKTHIFTPNRSDTTYPDLQFHSNSSEGALVPDKTGDVGPNAELVNGSRLYTDEPNNSEVNFTTRDIGDEVSWANELNKEHISPYGIRYSGQSGGRRKNKKSQKQNKRQQNKRQQNKGQQNKRQQNKRQQKSKKQRGGMGGASSDWKSTLYSRGPINTPEMTDINTPSFTDSQHISKPELLEDLGINRIKNQEVSEIQGSNIKSGVSSVHYGGRKKILS